LVKKYGTAILCQTFDLNAMPQTVFETNKLAVGYSFLEALYLPLPETTESWKKNGRLLWPQTTPAMPQKKKSSSF
jgi:hypothetical protein